MRRPSPAAPKSAIVIGVSGATRLDGIQNTAKSYGSAIRTCGKEKQWWRALGLIEVMLDDILVPDVITCCAAVSACVKSKEWQHALAVLDVVRTSDLLLDVIAYNAAISACERGGQWQQALGFLATILDHDLNPDVITYSACISACEKGAYWQQALHLLGATLHRGLEPDVITCCAAVSACVKGGEWQHALAILDVVRTSDLLLDTIAYNAAISACEKGEQWQQAIGFLATILDHDLNPSVITYSACISACEKAGCWQQALHLLAATLHRGLEPDVIMYSAALSVCGICAQWQQAFFILDLMQNNDFAPDVITYNSAISACGNANQWQQALVIMRAMMSDRLLPDVITYGAALSACEKGVQWQRALGLLEMMLRDELVPDTYAYGAVSTACEKGMQWQQALGLLEVMQNNRAPPNVYVYNAAISACLSSTKWESMLQLVDMMLGSGFDGFQATSYDHMSQAGSVLDSFKHITLIWLLQAATEYETPLTYVDTQAGRGVYDLDAEGALERDTSAYGIKQMTKTSMRNTSLAISAYLDALRRFNNDAAGMNPRSATTIRHYLGSPCLAQLWLRPQDRAVLFEMSEVMCSDLERSLGQLQQMHCAVEIMRKNSFWWLLRSPSHDIFEGRGLVLIDPVWNPYATCVAWSLRLLKHLYHEWPSSCIALWYPCLQATGTHQLYRCIQELQLGEVLVVEFGFKNSPIQAMLDSGLILLRPPPLAQTHLKDLLVELAELLESGPVSSAQISVFNLSSWETPIE